jgi:carotenoid cleavage dioxygenase-like enzyme
LDGYGILTKFEISDGPKVSLQSKYVKTEAMEKSVAAGRPIHTEYGTPAMTEGSKSLFSKIVSTLVG